MVIDISSIFFCLMKSKPVKCNLKGCFPQVAQRTRLEVRDVFLYSANIKQQEENIDRVMPLCFKQYILIV